jgi:hypothetical protein
MLNNNLKNFILFLSVYLRYKMVYFYLLNLSTKFYFPKNLFLKYGYFKIIFFLFLKLNFRSAIILSRIKFLRGYLQFGARKCLSSIFKYSNFSDFFKKPMVSFPIK